MIASVTGVAQVRCSHVASLYRQVPQAPLAGDLWQPEGLYKIPPDFQLLDEVATTDDSHKVLKDAKMPQVLKETQPADHLLKPYPVPSQ